MTQTGEPAPQPCLKNQQSYEALRLFMAGQTTTARVLEGACTTERPDGSPCGAQISINEAGRPSIIAGSCLREEEVEESAGRSILDLVRNILTDEDPYEEGPPETDSADEEDSKPVDLGMVCALQNIGVHRIDNHLDASLKDRLCLRRVNPDYAGPSLDSDPQAEDECRQPAQICGVIAAYRKVSDNPPEYASHNTKRGAASCPLAPGEEGLNVRDKRPNPFSFISEVGEVIRETPGLTEIPVELEGWIGPLDDLPESDTP